MNDRRQDAVGVVGEDIRVGRFANITDGLQRADLQVLRGRRLQYIRGQHVKELRPFLMRQFRCGNRGY